MFHTRTVAQITQIAQNVWEEEKRKAKVVTGIDRTRHGHVLNETKVFLSTRGHYPQGYSWNSSTSFLRLAVACFSARVRRTLAFTLSVAYLHVRRQHAYKIPSEHGPKNALHSMAVMITRSVSVSLGGISSIGRAMAMVSLIHRNHELYLITSLSGVD